MISPMIVYLVITGFIGAFKGVQRCCGSVRHRSERCRNEHHRRIRLRYAVRSLRRLSVLRLSGCHHPFAIVLTIICVNLLVSRRQNQ